MKAHQKIIKLYLRIRPLLKDSLYKNLNSTEKTALYASELYNDSKNLNIVAECIFPDPGTIFIEDQLRIAYGYKPDTLIT